MDHRSRPDRPAPLVLLFTAVLSRDRLRQHRTEPDKVLPHPGAESNCFKPGGERRSHVRTAGRKPDWERE